MVSWINNSRLFVLCVSVCVKYVFLWPDRYWFEAILVINSRPVERERQEPKKGETSLICFRMHVEFNSKIEIAQGQTRSVRSEPRYL